MYMVPQATEFGISLCGATSWRQYTRPALDELQPLEPNRPTWKLSPLDLSRM